MSAKIEVEKICIVIPVHNPIDFTVGGIKSLIRLLHSIYITTLGKGIISNYLWRNIKRRNFLLIKDYIKVLKYYVRPRIRYGSPSFDWNDARILIQKFDLKNKECEKERIKRSIMEMKEIGKI